jgi:hypothetical protein
MSRKCKTPAKLIALLDRQQGVMRHVDEVLRVKRTAALENQAAHVREKPEDYWIGLAHGANNMVEAVLHEHNCYAGFYYQGLTPVKGAGVDDFLPRVGYDDPEYAAWRVKYMVRE